MTICLKAQSDYTFLSSNITISDLINHARENHHSACCLIDKGNLFGSYEFYQTCIQNQIKPIIGLEVQVNYHQDIFPLLLIAKTEFGMQKLFQICSLINQFETKEIEAAKLSFYAQDIICVLSSEDSYLSFLLKENKIFQANEWMDFLQKIYHDLYIGIYRYKNADATFLNQLKEYAEIRQIPCVAMQIANHKKRNDFKIVKILNCIKNNQPFAQDEQNGMAKQEAYLKSNQEMKIFYDDHERKELEKLIATIHIKFPKNQFSLPDVFQGEDSAEKLRTLSYLALKEKGLDNHSNYIQRIEYELKTIIDMGFAKYYLVVADYVNYAKTHDIPVGPARGSGAASLVAYLLNITTIDPLQYDLLFERFLNPHRQNYPDFDIDFADIKREEVIEYVKSRYGYKHVAHIATFSTFGPKSAIRDVARILKISLDEVDYLLSHLSASCTSLQDEYRQNHTFKNLISIHQNLKNVVLIASQIEGLKKQVGLHAAGLILSQDDLSLLVPTFEDGKNSLTIQFDYQTCEKLGMVKMDFLGLKNLTIIDYCLKRENEVEHTTYDINNALFDDSKTYELIASGNTLGIFQLESEGMKNVIKKLRPTCFDDLIALIALYRPGPMKNIDSYIRRKNHEEAITYLDNRLTSVLEKTYGIIVYQEQIMLILQVLANYSLGEADIFRRAISKKKNDVLKQQKEKFIKGCVQNGLSEEKAFILFDYILRFAEYGFNKAHSVGYAKIIAIMAYSKAKHPGIFYESLLNVCKDGNEKKRQLVEEAKHFAISFAFPSCNHSTYHFYYENQQIRFGLCDIATIKENIADIILQERARGLFADWFDFIIRMAIHEVSLSVIADLIYAGALDEFQISRGKLIANLSSIYNAASMFSMFDYKPNSYQDEQYSFIQKPLLLFEDTETDYIKKEYELLGVYLSKHPIRSLKEKSVLEIVDLSGLKEDGIYQIIGKITQLETKKSRSDKAFLQMKLEDDTANLFIRDYQNPLKINDAYKKGDIVICKVRQREGYTYLNEIQKLEDGK